VQKVPGIAPGIIYLIVGSKFTGLRSSGSSGGTATASSSPSKSAGNLSKSYGGINASANICNNSGAFAGPDNPAAGT
jgi:hypothetical protein